MKDQDNTTMTKAVEFLRQQLHELVDRECDSLLFRLSGEEDELSDVEQEYMQRTYSLHMPPSLFKGQKPVSITFKNGHTTETRTWKDTATVLLKECNADPVMHQRLLDLRGKVLGRQRMILGDSPDGMDVPLKIDDDIFVEGKYDTETLMYVITERIFRAVGYDYGGIEVTVKNPKCPYVQRSEQEQEEYTGPSMGMQM